MELAQFANTVKAARCPYCGGGPKNIFVAKQKNGVLNEPLAAHQTQGGAV